MAKAPRKTKSKSLSPTCQNLINAISFISVAQKPEDDAPYKTHCVLHNGWAMAFNGTITAGAKIEETLEIAPNTYKLIAALERTTKDVSITELEGRLSIKSGSFSCFVPCWHEGMPALAPDPPLCGISDVLRDKLEQISGFTVDSDKKRIVECSILIRENSAFASDGAVLLEAWHGLNLPTCILPKAFVTAIINTKKKLTKFGRSDNSCTVYFEDESWLRSQLYEESWPDINVILNKPSKPEPLPKGFFEALNNVEPFSNGKEAEKTVYFVDGALQSHRDKHEGAVCEVAGLRHGPAFNIKRLKRIESCIETVDFYSHNVAFFYGYGVRGAIAGVSS